MNFNITVSTSAYNVVHDDEHIIMFKIPVTDRIPIALDYYYENFMNRFPEYKIEGSVIMEVDYTDE